MPPFAHLLIGQILVDRHRLAPDAVDAALRQQDEEERTAGETRFLGEIMVERQLVTREQVAEALAFQREQFAQSLVGPYRLESMLGRGGAGTVYRAVRLGGKRESAAVALKLLPQKRPGDVNALARFQREAQAGVGLDHPHIVRTLDFGTTRDCYYLVCELMPNGTLSDRVRVSGPLSEADGLLLAVAMLQALDHASARGLVHRDIKPANIIYDASDQPRLADLGLVQAMSGDQGGPRDRTAGTPAFIAPEQAMGQDQSHVRGDLYSLGATLFFAFTGAPPFVEKDPLAVINQHLNGVPPEVNTINRGIGAATSALVRKLMAKRSEDRYGDPVEAIADVRRIQAGERPLAMALTPEQAYAPLNVQVQNRDSGGSDLTPTHATRINQATPVSSLTPRGNRTQVRPAGTRSQELAKTAREPGTDRTHRRPAGTRSQELAKTAREPGTDRRERAKRGGGEPEALNDRHPRDGRGRGEAKAGAASKARVATKGGQPWALLIAGGVIISGLAVLGALLLLKDPPAKVLPPAAVEAVAATPKPSGTVVDLLEHLDAKKLQEQDWLLRDGVLMSPRGVQNLLAVPWLPPAEYDLTCSFKRLYPSGSLSLLFDIAGRQCALVIAGDSDLRLGFEMVGGKSMQENGSQHLIAEPLAPDKRITVTIQVRRSGLSARIGDKEVCHLPGLGSDLALDPQWKLPKGHVIALGTRTTQVAVFRLRLTELSGAGAPVAAK